MSSGQEKCKIYLKEDDIIFRANSQSCYWRYESKFALVALVFFTRNRETCRVNRVIVPPEYMEDVGVSSESSDDEVIFIKDDGKEEKLNTSHGDQKTPKRYV